MISKLRSRAGAAKWWIQCHQPQVLMHRWRAPALREAFRDRVSNLRPVPVPESGTIEIHTLCGHNQVDMAIWSLMSLCRYESVDMAVYLHSDGTLDAQDGALLRRLLPGIHIVMTEEADALWSSHPFHTSSPLDSFRRESFYGRKLVDSHNIGESAWIYLLDTDVLFFQEPLAMLHLFHEAVESDSSTYIGWDAPDSLVASPGVVTQAVGWPPASRFNAGALFLPRFDEATWRCVAGVLRAFRDDWVRHPWSEQTVYALLAARGKYRSLSADYRVGGAPGGNCVALHYVGVPTVRPRMFTEGIPRIFQELPGA